MREAGLDALAVACPACFTQFDTGQLLLRPARSGRRGRLAGNGRPRGETPSIPVLHIAELTAYALGMDPEAMDLGSHKIRPRFLEAAPPGVR